MIVCPCKGCENRKLGCHNVDTCPAWKTYVEAVRDAKGKRHEESARATDFHEHLKRRRFPMHMR